MNRPATTGRWVTVDSASSGAGGPVRDADEPRAAVFHREGVLVDSEAHHHAAWHRLCREEGDILAQAQVAEHTPGRSVHESLPAFLGRRDRESLSALLGRYVDADEIERPTGGRRDEVSLSFRLVGRRYRLLHHPTSVTSSWTATGPRKAKAGRPACRAGAGVQGHSRGVRAGVGGEG
jgi:hypothetical protein